MSQVIFTAIFVLYFLSLTGASFPGAEPAIQVPRRSASLYWVNRAQPNKFKKYRTFNALQSMGLDKKKRFSENIHQMLKKLLNQ
ncbi:unnamed protein product [Caenorhabditis auriculariae]|uniref:Uncharacterized protein n=1 Tax=Caenorhabditis auriculariae TaxID=2777116 RepID=A0A8S1HCI1_9PELO|nr:unnamed protein product [Caenorhabditis auriculariae]